jgi:hypothetical protein
MDPKIKAKWVAALRSGDYVQGQGVLRDKSRHFCCLGVLCDVAARDGIGKWIEPTGEDDDDDDGTRFSFVTFDPNDGTFGDLLPPLAVVKWAGLPAPDPTVSDSSLTVWNDYDGASFDEIAALIEKHL